MKNEIDVERLSKVLQKVDESEIQNKHPMISAIVVLSSTKLPSKGFYTNADKLNQRKIKDNAVALGKRTEYESDHELAKRMCGAVFSYWKNKEVQKF